MDDPTLGLDDEPVEVVLSQVDGGKPKIEYLNPNDDILDLVFNIESKEAEKQAIKPKISMWTDKSHLDVHTKAGLAALGLWNRPPKIFQMGGNMIIIKQDSEDIYKIDKINNHLLKGYLAEAAIWSYVEMVNGLMVSCDVYPPNEIVNLSLKYTENWKDIPFLKGLTATPIPRLDGTINREYGYDSETGYYFTPGLDLPEILEKPTKEDAIKAANYLLTELFSDFPLKDDASKANMLAGLVSPILRPICGKTPLFILTKPIAGEGSSLLVDIIGLVCTGIEAYTQDANVDNGTEWRKIITSMLRAGTAIAKLDNLNQYTTFNSSVWAAFLMGDRWRDRILKESTMTDLYNTLCTYLTGRNVRIGGDLPRRSVLIEMFAIDPELIKHPEQRHFRHKDIKTWILENRGDLVAAIFTMIRAWSLAGKPSSNTPIMGMYEPWCEIVGGILNFAEVKGFLGNRDKIYAEMDTETDAWLDFVQKWHSIKGNDKLTAKQILTLIIASNNGLKDLIPPELEDAVKNNSSKSLGRLLSAQRNVPFKNYAIRVEIDPHHNDPTTYWIEEGDIV